MAGDLVLLTGATGHLGFRTLRYALEFGYQVRAAVRSEAKANTIRNNAVLKAMCRSDQLSFAIVPDFLAPGAFDEAARGVKYIIHVASPIPIDVPAGADIQKFYIQPAVQGTLGVLESARKAGDVQRVIITSSVVAIVPLAAMFQSDGLTYNAESRQPDSEGPFANDGHAYVVSKVAALNRAEAWVKAEKPAFDVIHIHPSYIIGRDDLADSTADFQTGTNSMPLNLALGTADPASPGHVNSYNSLNDTARNHLLALDPKIKGNQSFLCTSSGADGFNWDMTNAIVQKHFPEEVKLGILPNDRHYPSIELKTDIRKTEEAFGKQASYEEVVVSVVGHWLELYKKEQGELKN